MYHLVTPLEATHLAELSANRADLAMAWFDALA
jgi:hypothetical protein